MDMPKPTEEHRRLKALAGEWTGEEKIHPSPWDQNGGMATVKANARLDLDGFFVITDHEQTRNGRVSYRGHGIFGWDAGKKHYTMHWFDVMGCDPGAPAIGNWDGNTLKFQHSHEKGHGRFTYVFERDGLYTMKMEHSKDGKNWMPFLDGTYKRVS